MHWPIFVDFKQVVLCEFTSYCVTFFSLGHGRKVGPSPGAPGPTGPVGPGPPVPGTLGLTGTSVPQDTWEITSTVWNSESKHPETIKLKHKPRNFLNYIIGQSKRKFECTFWGYFIYQVVNNDYSRPISPLLPSSTSLLSQEMTPDWIYLNWKKQSISYITVCQSIYKNTLPLLQI